MTCKPHVSASVGLLISLLSGGCSLTPAATFDKHAAQLNLESYALRSENHAHRVFSKTGSNDNGLRIYFGSDGTPWLTNTSVARDPTPRRPIALDLLANDPGPAVYIGRPCYHRQMRNCTPQLWTTGRYSESVVASMTEAAHSIIASHPGLEVTLVGYSGGGVLALLVADRIPEVTRVVTLAANLDVDKWTARHGYLPLSASISPAEHASWRADLIQIHLTGGRDHNVPPDNHDRLQRTASNATFRQISEFSHDCCWVEQWPALLDEAIATRPQPALREEGL